MLKSKSLTLFVISSILLGACLGPAPQGGVPSAPGQNNPDPPIGDTSQPVPAQDATQSATAQAVATVEEGHDPSEAAHYSDVDLTDLEVGDGKVSSSPQVGYIYSCMTQFNGSGAQATGSWMNGDGTWDATEKTVVDGSVTWPSNFTITVQGDQRVFQSNDLPDHSTGTFPINPSDDAYQVDRNPNSIQAQSITLSLPANPTAAARPNCVGGEVGIMLSGVLIFSAFDAGGNDAVAHEVQDNCDGHPQKTGFYHYHSLSDCIKDNATGHSGLVGYAFDGYGLYGYYGEDGKELTNDDLDECHAHAHMIGWNGQMVEMYHYHATHEFPYVVGCFHGTPAVHAVSGPGGGQQQGGGQQGQGQPGGTQPQGGQGNGQQPPQAAIDACAGLSQNATCSIGPMTGTCQMPAGTTQLACVPQGGPPSP